MDGERIGDLLRADVHASGIAPSEHQQNSREKDPSIYTTIHRVAFVLLLDSAQGIQSFRRMEGSSGELGEVLNF